MTTFTFADGGAVTLAVDDTTVTLEVAAPSALADKTVAYFGATVVDVAGTAVPVIREFHRIARLLEVWRKEQDAGVAA